MGTASAISEQDRRKYNEAADLINRSVLTGNDQEAYAIWERALILAGCCHKCNQTSADFNYLLGYIYYKAPKKTAETWSRAEQFLSEAVQLNPFHHLARYYLGCVLFDRGRFSEALITLQLLPSIAFKEEGQEWRTLKATELQLCCKIYIDADHAPLEEAQRLYEAYASFGDISMAPLPSELAECLSLQIAVSTATYQILQVVRTCRQIFRLLRSEDLLRERWPSVYRV